MRLRVILCVSLLLFSVAASAMAQDRTPSVDRIERAQSWEAYQRWSRADLIKVYKAVIASDTHKEWSRIQIPGRAAMDPSLGAYDKYLTWMPMSPMDFLETDMFVRKYEAVIPKMTYLLHERWREIHFGPKNLKLDDLQSSPVTDPGHVLGSKAVVVGTNRNSAYNYSPAPDDFSGEVQLSVNPLNTNQIVTMANTWDNMGDTANCGGGTQAVFFSSDGGATWGYTCSPRGSLYSGLSCTNEAGSDPALYWDDQNNIFADYMSLCYNATWSAVNGYAMVVAKSTDGGANWTPHGILQNSYSTGTVEDKNFYIIDNNPGSPYYGRHYSCWDRGNNELIKYSSDGGVNWTEVNIPNVGSGLDLGCEMAVQKNGTIHIIFDNLTCGGSNCTDEDMYYTRSTNGGVSWASLVHVRDITNPISFGATSNYGPQDQRGLNPFGAIDVDNSGGACDGYLYVTFTDDADNNGVGTADIWASRSIDGGATWQTPVRVNDTPDPDTSIQFHPFLVVDQADGAVYVTWHDARNDPANHAVDYFVTRSTDCGLSFETNIQASQPSGEFNNSSISYTNENSTDNSNANPNQFGEYMGLDVHQGTAYLAWVDSRHFFPSSTSDPQKENIGFAKVVFCSAVAPTGLSASANGDNQIDLSWSAASGATEYRIYRSQTSGGPYTLVGTSASTTYSDTTVSGSVTYYYIVTTYTDCESPQSDEVSALTTGLCTVPPTFAGLQTVTAMPNDLCGLRLDWDASTFSCSGGPTVYNIYKSTTPGFTADGTTLIDWCVADLYYEDTDVGAGTTYYYIVRAEDNATGNGGPCGDGYEESNVVEVSGTLGGTAGEWTEYFELGSTDWTGTGLWHEVDDTSCVTPSATSPTHAWYYGRDGFCDYNTGAATSGALVSPTIPNVTTASKLSFWYWRQVEYVSGASWDATTVEVSYDGGAWEDVLSLAAGDPSAADWVNFEDYALTPPSSPSNMRIRFTFDSVDNFDNAFTGWLIDDILVTNLLSSSCTTPADPVQYFAARSTSETVKLEWQNPSGGTYSTTRICVDTSSFPTDPVTCTPAGPDQGVAGLDSYDTMTLAGTNGTTYYYAAFVDNGAGGWSPEQTVTARPFDTSQQTKWSYHTGATALAPPGLYPGAAGTGASYGVSNDRVFHGMNSTTGGGDWPRTAPFDWLPMGMNGPAQSRPPIVPTAITGDQLVAFLGSQDGYVYAVNAETGETLWQSDNYGLVQGAPSGMFSEYGGLYDLVFAGTRVAGSDNTMNAINPVNGFPIWDFDDSIGIISSSATVDYENNRLYFASRENPTGSDHTLWCISFTDLGAAPVWSKPYGDIDSAPVLFDGVLYVGTNAGSVMAVDPATGDQIWSYATNNGPVKGYVDFEFVTGTPRKVFFATTDNVWALTDNGTSAAFEWVRPIAGPSIPLTLADLGALYVGSTDGRLYQLDAADGSIVTSILMGAGTATVGSPGYDWMNSLAYVGAEDGAVYAVTLPLQ